MATKNRILFSPQFFLLRHYLRNKKTNYLYCLADKQKIEEVRKTISKMKIVFLSQKNNNTETVNMSQGRDINPRLIDLCNHFPMQAKKFIKYRKEKDGRKRN